MRRKKDGTKANPPNKRQLTELYVRKVKGKASGAYNVWDAHQPGLVLRIQSSGHKAWKCVYRFHSRPQWYHVGDAKTIGLADARRIASKIMMQALEGRDPVTERKAERSAGTFGELSEMYLEQHAKKKNRSWRQADWLIKKHALPVLGKLRASAISRSDVKAMMARIEAPIAANQALAATSAIFSWAIKEEVGGIVNNPCQKIDRNPVNSRERILSDGELPRFWAAFDSAGLVAGTALKVALLCGQRVGEICHMRKEHLIDGWWELPGLPSKFWPGTKNGKSHRVFLMKEVRALIAELTDEGAEPTVGYIFAGPRGKPIANLSGHMQTISAKLCSDNPVRPHDLRRSFGSMVTAAGFGRQAMDRILNHADSSVGSIYDRHSYQSEDRHIMETIAQRILALAEGREAATNVVPLKA